MPPARTAHQAPSVGHLTFLRFCCATTMLTRVVSRETNDSNLLRHSASGPECRLLSLR